MITDAQAEVIFALSLCHFEAGSCVAPGTVFPNRNNQHNGARRTFHKLVAKGLIEQIPAWHEYKLTPHLFAAFDEWKRKGRNFEKIQGFDLYCF
jgi:hypothetical protein